MLMGMYDDSHQCVSMDMFEALYTYMCGLLRCSFRLGWAMRDA